MNNVFDGSLGVYLFWIVAIGFVIAVTILTVVLLVQRLREPTDSEWDDEKEWRRMRRG